MNKRYPESYPEQMNQLNNQMNMMSVTQAGYNKLWVSAILTLIMIKLFYLILLLKLSR